MRQLIFILLLFTGTSCYSDRSNIAMKEESATASLEDQAAMEMEEQYQGVSVNDKQADPKPVERKLIRTAEINLEVDKYAVARQSIDEIVAKYKAFISNETESKSYYRLENRLTIRIAPESFDAFISDLEKLALNVDHKSINTNDVTRQYVDLETRLASKRAVVEQYRSILKRANTIKDILAVEENLRVVTEEIESTEAQLRYLKDQVGLSTITATIYEPLEQSPAARRSFMSRVGRAFKNGWEGLVELSIGLVTIWPLLLIGGVLIYFVRRIWRKRRGKKNI